MILKSSVTHIFSSCNLVSRTAVESAVKSVFRASYARSGCSEVPQAKNLQKGLLKACV